jgi:cell division protein FtsI (penicillin-binding protein 3)
MLARPQLQSKPRPDTSLRRTLLVAATIVLWMLAISARLVYLQISQRDNLTERARKQQQGAIETAAQRGQLLDCEGRSLARSVLTESIFVAPDEIDDLAGTARLLATALDLDQTKLLQQLSEAKSGSSRFVWIARRLDADKAGKILALHLAGIHSRPEAKRFYPNGSLAAHVLGFVGIDNAGQAGVEKFYNQKISGDSGKLFIERDSGGRSYESFEVAAKPGQDVVLTLNEMIQYRAEQAVAAAVAQAHAKSGTAIVLDPYTGEILALANAPTFDPNSPGSTAAETRSNGALQNVYEPGSTFKIVAYSAAIEKGLVKPDDKIDCQMGKITVAGRVIHDHKPFGVLTVAEALAKSSNVGAIKLGLKVGDQAMYEFIKRFGFGARTGVELPWETAGLLRPVGDWDPSSIGSIAMGQEVGVTPLQMAAAFAAVANSGMRVAPHLVREIRGAGGAVIQRTNPEQRRVISAETANQLKGMLEGVTLRGTAKKAQLDGYSAAGKTGTAQKIDPQTHRYSKTRYVASFVGFAPVEHPAVVIIVVIDEPAGSHHGGDVAAPVFREIAEQILPDLGIAPDTQLKPGEQVNEQLIAQTTQAEPGAAKLAAAREEAEQARRSTLPEVTQAGQGGEIVYAAATRNAMVMPDLRGRSVRDVARTCAQLGLQVEARGEGRVRRQIPAPGAEVANRQVVQVEFGRVE